MKEESLIFDCSSRDTIMHFSDAMRNKVYRNILKTLKPGGRLLVSDYCRGEKESTQEFLDYEKQRGYNLWTVKRYGKCLDDTGFSNVVATDKTEFLIKSMRRELKDFYEMKGHFINKYSQKDFDDLESVTILSSKVYYLFLILTSRAGKRSWCGALMASLLGDFSLLLSKEEAKYSGAIKISS